MGDATLSSRVFDGASVSLDRQLSMIRFILRNNKRGVKFDEICFHMTVTHGNTQAWVTKYMKQWATWGIIEQRHTKFYVNEEKWASVQKAREEDFTVLE